MKSPIAWSIAGSDSSAAAGVQADLKTMKALDVEAYSIITAVTTQTQHQVFDIQFIDIEPQLNSLKSEHYPQAIKLGMLGTRSTVEAVGRFLQKNPMPVILDPVMISTSGHPLFLAESLDYKIILQTVFPFIELLTPNIPETEALLNCKITTYETVEQAARRLLSLGVKNVLIKGGHFLDPLFSQDYWTDGKEAFWLASPRYSQNNFRGSGCTLSSAIAAARAKGHSIKDAIIVGKMFINQSLSLSQGTQLQYATWPQDQQFLPYCSKQPIAQFPEPFSDCGKKSLGLYPIVDRAHWLSILLPLGVNTIQLRIKDLNDDELEIEIQSAIHFAKQYGARLFINDYWELAIKWGAYGVHLGQEDLDTADLAAIKKAGLRLGVSTHEYYEVARAHALNPSYIAFGAIYPTTLKKMTPQGLDKLIYWRRTLQYPLVAIGGITAERTHTIVATGVSGVALISAITQAKNPIEVTQSLLAIVNNHGLSPCEIHRYAQQIKLPNIGLSGQLKLKNARVLCVGAGGLASPVLLYCAAAGIGTVGIVDDDEVDLSNLQRQILFGTEHIGRRKAEMAQQQILALNPHTEVNIHITRFNEFTAPDLLKEYDIVVNCTDNFATQYLLNDFCFTSHTPYVYASISQYSGQCTVFDGVNGPCFRCLFPMSPTKEAIPNCSQGGVLGVLPGMLGVIQAAEVLKWILGLGDLLIGRLLSADVATMTFKEYHLTRDPACLMCQPQEECTMKKSSPMQISPAELHQKMQSGEPIVLIDVRSPEEHAAHNIGGLLIPLSDLAHRACELNPDDDIILYCHAGQRSLYAADILNSLNFKSVKSLAGGLKSWES